MLRRAFVAIGLVLVAGALRPATFAEELPPPSRWIPRDAVVSLEINRPKEVLSLLLDSKLAEAVTNHPVYKQATAQPGFQQFRGVIQYLEGQLDTDWKTGLKKLTGGGATAAITSNGIVLVMIDAEDGKLLTKLMDMIVGFAKTEAENQGNPNRVKSADYRGATCWEFSDGRAHAIVGNRFISANKAEGLKAVLDTRAGSEGDSLTALPAYQTAKKAAGEEATATAFVNLAMLKQHPAVQQAIGKNTNPMGALLFAGLIDAVRQSNWLALALKVEDQTLTLETTLDSKRTGKSELAAFARSEKPGEGILPNLAVPRTIAGLSFYRDLHGFYAAKDKLFPERTSGLIFFENMMGIFFSGRDLTEEVLSQFRPEIRFVVAEQKYDPEVGIPQVQVPAFALILKVFRPNEAAELMEEAFQKAVGLVSFTSGQKGVPGLIVDRPTHADVRYTVAYSGRVRGEAKGPVGMRYNFRPALAKLGDYVVISSTDGLARDLIDALKKEVATPPKAQPETNRLVEVDGAQVASILAANRSTLVRQNMTEKGSSQREAETNIGMLLAAVKLFGKATLTLGERDDKVQARLAVKLNP
jgi:carbon monoxide dehydrogenase subunit G